MEQTTTPTPMNDVAFKEQLSALRGRIRDAQRGVSALESEMAELKRKRWPVRCCRCWPSLVSDDGTCACCGLNHVTGERADNCDPEYDL